MRKDVSLRGTHETDEQVIPTSYSGQDESLSMSEAEETKPAQTASRRTREVETDDPA